jgi:hypothetical protein
MIRLLLLLGLCISTSGALASGINETANDSLSDVFPLAVGYQWTYAYHYQSGGFDVIYDFKDTGFVNITLVGVTSTADSNCWLVQEVGTHWTTTNGMPWQGPTVMTDTLELVEATSSTHRLYITKRSEHFRGGVWPFLDNLADTAQVVRYSTVDTSGNVRLRTFAYPDHTPVFTFVFRRGIGPCDVVESDGLTGTTWYGTHHTLRNATVTGTMHGDREREVAQPFSLYHNYPNPFNPVTSVVFDLHSRVHVTMDICDILGRPVATIVSETLEPGRHLRQWNAMGFSSGTYYCRMKAGNVVQTRALVLIK